MKLFIFAEKEEIELALNHFEIIHEEGINEKYSDFQKLLLCKNKNRKFYIAFTGVGKVNASMFLSYILATHNDIEEVINIGPAGTIKNIEIGSLILAQNLAYFDTNLTTLKNYKLGELPKLNQYFSTNKKLNEKIQHIFSNITLANVVTADKFFSKNDIEEINKNFENVYAVDMEATSLAHTTLIYKINFSSIKVISDNLLIEDNGKDYHLNSLKWKTKISEVIFKLLEVN
ncbi:adenosylhomocysteine nucleosidase [Metamycoplasma subdolum]|uniref:Adenosylhomocysteine nucleosidase n=1 Tax=Metamycoplasma subdolum TaxID=92407 RepID=A0A3M0A2Z3_9BACT|nr:5'-methylthioadenosine/S-adenosylhomocysteine nucleosidase [Metamycoplasma subdolum]RMA79016.1 adenosylhomocysteine nucleosidase [Metamycoplasma subdolum]WPB50539.1 5'-methylthioadenosine/S-adenosylhomocysteine nucleosidase [Metamycoplasma subdolum]